MDHQLRADVLQRLEADFGLQHMAGTQYMRKGTCPQCNQRRLFSRYDEPWFIRCGREQKCRYMEPVKELYGDLFDDWSKRAPATDDQPAASAKAYLTFARGFDVGMIEGWYTQEHYFDRDLNIGSATVRFPLDKGGYWERLIDKPNRFGKKKARFKPGESYKGYWWVPPCVDLLQVDELWIVEGIFDAIALVQNGIPAVAALSSNAYPEESLKALITARSGKTPKLIWALDNEPGAHKYTRMWVRQARDLGFTCDAAQIPQPDSRKVDWNDLHQRWAFMDDVEARTQRIDKELDDAKHHGALLIAESAVEKALLMYQWREREEFHFGFDSRLYWWKLDISKFNSAMQALDASDNHEDQQLNDKARRAKALRMSGCVVEIANCYPKALYFQRNEITDESWYFFRVDFPHDGGSVKNTFTGGQVAAASEFKKRLLGMGAGAVFTGSGQQLDKIMKDQLFGIKTVQTIDYVGYSREYGCYVFNDIAVREGQLISINEEEFFEMGKLKLKSLQKGVKIALQKDAKDYDQQWLNLLWQCFGAQGTVALTFWFGSLFAEQIRARYQSFPFLEATGEAGAGKTTLLTLLWKLLGREGYEGFDPSKSTKAGRSRLMGQISGMPVVLLESDRSGDDKAHAKTFEWDELKDYYGGGTLATKGVKTAGNETYEPPFRATIAISQNAPVVASEAIMTRIVKLHFVRPTVTAESRAAADLLNSLDGTKLSNFLLQAVRKESEVMELFAHRMPGYEAKLRALHSHCFACETPFKAEQDHCGHCGNKLRAYIRVERINKNHAQLLALLDCLRLVLPLSEPQISHTRTQIIRMAIERQSSISSDHPVVAEFWEVYEYLEGLDADGPVVNHSKKDNTIAINLNDFVKCAAEHRQKVADISELRERLKDSRSRKLIDTNKATDSAVRAHQAKHSNAVVTKQPIVKCWIFQA
ncbi:bifunctional DNA primase/helicase [Pseudomonas umsongensis]|uniref:toprim domain-containing protein n=1 Tax=Pseudomonas umsongensis TaxID=198618 RepID=UPI0012444A15|nr:toprim domain-containing protein [Pseudomonas umsongensis]QFG33945.1 bifunctional DNA primase/helicase [Pseudomonas umsongensis]